MGRRKEGGEEGRKEEKGEGKKEGEKGKKERGRRKGGKEGKKITEKNMSSPSPPTPNPSEYQGLFQ